LFRSFTIIKKLYNKEKGGKYNMNVTTKTHKYSRLVERFPVDEGILTIIVASLRTIATAESSGKVVGGDIIQGPTVSFELLNEETTLTKANYELSCEEFDEIVALHQIDNKEAFINYSKE
jgi:hypothetical protein